MITASTYETRRLWSQTVVQRPFAGAKPRMSELPFALRAKMLGQIPRGEFSVLAASCLTSLKSWIPLVKSNNPTYGAMVPETEVAAGI